MTTNLTRRRLELLTDVAAANSQPAGQLRALAEGRTLVYVYAYLAVWKQTASTGWNQARSYVTGEAEHIPGLATDVTATARHLVDAGLIVLGEPGRRRSERPYLLTEAGRALLAELIPREDTP